MDDPGGDSTRRWLRVVWPIAAIVLLAAVAAVPIAGDRSEPSGSVSSDAPADVSDVRPSASLPFVGSADPADVAASSPTGPVADAANPVPSAGASSGAASVRPTDDVRPTGPGIDDEKITIGIGWFDINAYAAVLAPDAERSDGTTRDAADAIVRWLNERGGIAGRQIEPIYHEYPLQDVLGSASTRNTREQAMCSDWTEDHRAFAAIPWISSMGTFYECAAQHNLVTVATSFSEGLVDETLYERIGHVWYSPHGLVLDRREKMFVTQLDRRGFFTPESKVGVILRDHPATRGAAERALFPALAARGAKDVEVAYYSEISTDWNNIILRFRGAGVTHVVWGSGASSFIVSGQFMTASENQGYRPYNAIGSDHGIAGHTLVTPEAQRERIVAVGWSPLDVGGDRYEVAKPNNDNDALCRRVKKESGSDLDQSLFVPYCDGLFFIKQVLETAPELTAEGFRATVEAPSFAFSTVDAWSTMFLAKRHDGAGAVRDVLYNPECTCFVFSGPNRPVD